MARHKDSGVSIGCCIAHVCQTLKNYIHEMGRHIKGKDLYIGCSIYSTCLPNYEKLHTIRRLV